MFRLFRTGHVPSINQSVKQPIHQSINLSIKQPITQPFYRNLTCLSTQRSSKHHSKLHSINRSRYPLITPSLYQPISHINVRHSTSKHNRSVNQTNNPNAHKAQAWPVNQTPDQEANRWNSQPNSHSTSQSSIPSSSQSNGASEPNNPSNNSFHWSMIFPYPEFNRSVNRSINQPLKFLGTSVLRAALETAMLCTSLIVSVRLVAPVMDQFIDRSIDPMMFSMYVSIGSMGFAALNYMTLAAILSKTKWRINQSNEYSNDQSNRKKWSIPATIILCLSGSFMAVCLLPLFGRHSQEEPMIYHMIMQSINQPINLVFACLFGPLVEEIVFRGLYFARVCCVSGLNAGYLLSSILFGGLHSSAESDKVVDCLIVGLFLCLAYRMSGSLIAPVAVHILNNSIGSAYIALFAPDFSPSTLTTTIGLACSVQQAAENIQFFFASLIARSSEGKNPFVQSDANGLTFKPEMMKLVDAIFAILDRGSKGFLKSDEYVFFATLAPATSTFLCSAMAVIEQRGTSRAWTDIRGEPRFDLPSKHFLGPFNDRATAASQRLFDAVTEPESVFAQMRQAHVIVPNEALRRLEASSKIFEVETHRWMNFYYTVFVTASELARQGDEGPAITSRDEFRQECLKFALIDPNAFSSMLQEFTNIAMGTSMHPLAFHDHPVRPLNKTQTKIESMVEEIHLQK